MEGEGGEFLEIYIFYSISHSLTSNVRFSSLFFPLSVCTVNTLCVSVLCSDFGASNIVLHVNTNFKRYILKWRPNRVMNQKGKINFIFYLITCA